jgi:4-amino-4-deoxy-L-arabinose transferase-like glycosyltransferase
MGTVSIERGEPRARAAGKRLRRLLRANPYLVGVLALTVCIRALLCALSNNEHGDADARALMSADWALAPSFIRSGTWLPLHFYATGALTRLLGDPIAAGKALSFVTGSLTVVPLFGMVQRLFDKPTAAITGLFFAIYGTHAGLSSTVMSEAPFAFFAICALDVLFREICSQAPPRAGWIAVSALLLAIAGGFRQEAWQLAGIVTLYMLWKPTLRRYAIAYALLSLSTFVVWDVLNSTADQGLWHGLTAVASSKAHETLYHHSSAAHNALKWIWIYVQSPGLVISLLAVLGLYMALQGRVSADLAIIATLLVTPYVALSLIKPEWQPQARWTVISELLIFPYAAAATVDKFAQRQRLWRATVVILLVSVVSQCIAFHRRSHLFLPVEDYNRNDLSAWTWLAGNARSSAAVVVEDVDYRAPSLVLHAALYVRAHRIVYADDAPRLERIVSTAPRPTILVLHSPPARWPLLNRLQPELIYENSDYRILRLD